MKNYDTDLIVLPQLDVLNICAEHREVYLRFMGHLRKVPVSRMEIKILSSIQFTADMMDCSDANIAKTLVDMGLRAPRIAFPNSFLDFVDRALMRQGWEIGAPSESILALQRRWFKYSAQDSDTLHPFRHVHSVVREEVLG